MPHNPPRPTRAPHAALSWRLPILASFCPKQATNNPPFAHESCAPTCGLAGKLVTSWQASRPPALRTLAATLTLTAEGFQSAQTTCWTAQGVEEGSKPPSRDACNSAVCSRGGWAVNSQGSACQQRAAQRQENRIETPMAMQAMETQGLSRSPEEGERWRGSLSAFIWRLCAHRRWHVCATRGMHACCWCALCPHSAHLSVLPSRTAPGICAQGKGLGDDARQ